MEQIRLEIVPSGIEQTAHASQFDHGRQIRFNLFNNGSAYTLSGAETITMVVNGQEEAVANTSDNYIVWDVAPEDCENEGVIECELRIVENDVLIGSKNFFLEVEYDPYGAGVVVLSAQGDPATFDTDLADYLKASVIDIGYNANGYMSATILNSETAPAFDAVPYLFRKSGGDLPSIGGQEFDTLVGGSVAFNQYVKNGNFTDTSEWSADSNLSLSATNNTIKVTTNAAGYLGRISQNMSEIIPKDHKVLVSLEYYYHYSVSVTSAQFILRSNPNSIITFNTVNNEWRRVSSIVNTRESVDHFDFLATSATMSGVEVGDYAEYRNCMLIDLTQMFGSTIADYIYNLETQTTGAGVSFFKSLFGADYYPRLPRSFC